MHRPFNDLMTSDATSGAFTYLQSWVSVCTTTSSPSHQSPPHFFIKKQGRCEPKWKNKRTSVSRTSERERRPLVRWTFLPLTPVVSGREAMEPRAAEGRPVIYDDVRPRLGTSESPRTAPHNVPWRRSSNRDRMLSFEPGGQPRRTLPLIYGASSNWRQAGLRLGFSLSSYLSFSSTAFIYLYVSPLDLTVNPEAATSWTAAVAVHQKWSRHVPLYKSRWWFSFLPSIPSILRFRRFHNFSLSIYLELYLFISSSAILHCCCIWLTFEAVGTVQEDTVSEARELKTLTERYKQ